MKKIGIWLDKEKAHVIVINEKKEDFITVPSEMEFYNPKGGSRSKTRWGPQEVIAERTYLEREKQQMKKYFEKLVALLQDAEAIVLFGPADTCEKLGRFLKEDYPQLAPKLKGVFKQDSMTDNQVRAWVRDYYS
ncbi:hypothetical protein [Poritiphilus flavus]|uniref:Protein required for attachment to host cells n=1 Tax=Poritiphilus flavus TaxID=2697053 RepID=A0A6L9EBI7_9FLAO|nr:hypothetical protein [Poritiphilus flavus]NAS11931.1 hypothetical protein [Poritiphilus flavus]